MASKKSTPEVPRKAVPKGPSPHFATAAGGGGVRVTPGAGGQNLGTPTYCTSKRSAPNVRSY